jgi:hypothetical protein
MELQKIHPTKNNYDEFVLNFNEEPNKSQKQIHKLIKMFAKHVQTRSEYIKKMFPQEDQIHIPNMDQEEVSRIIHNDTEEKAMLLFSTYHKKTSVLYDV